MTQERKADVEGMEQRKKAIVLGGTVPHIELIRQLKARGYAVVLVDYLADSPAKRFADLHVRESTLDHDKVLEVAREQSADLVIATCIDHANATACDVLERLGRKPPYSYATAIAVTDKRLMKQTMAEAGLPTSPFVTVGSPDENVDLRYPVVVKPVDSNGNRGIRKVDDPADLRDAIATAIAASRTGSAIVEEYVEGTETSLYAYVLHGRARIITSNERQVFVERATGKMPGFAMIYPCAAVDAQRDRLQALCDKVAAAFGLDNTPLTVQAKIDGDKVSLIEVMPRIGGGQSYWNIRRLTGFDMIAAAIDSFEGVEPDLSGIGNPEMFTATNNIYAKAGVFAEVLGGDALLADGTVDEFRVLRHRGDEMSGGLTSGDRACAFVVVGADREEVVDRSRRAFARVEVVDGDGRDMKRADIHM